MLGGTVRMAFKAFPLSAGPRDWKRSGPRRRRVQTYVLFSDVTRRLLFTALARPNRRQRALRSTTTNNTVTPVSMKSSILRKLRFSKIKF